MELNQQQQNTINPAIKNIVVRGVVQGRFFTYPVRISFSPDAKLARFMGFRWSANVLSRNHLPLEHIADFIGKNLRVALFRRCSFSRRRRSLSLHMTVASIQVIAKRDFVVKF